MNADEDALIRNRLVVKELQLRRLINRYLEWTAKLPEKSLQEAENDYQMLLAEISQYELNMLRNQLVEDMAEDESNYYLSEYERLENEIANTQKEIKGLRSEFASVLQDRQRQMEYDVLTMKLNKLPTRESSQETIKKLKLDIELLEEEKRAHEATFERRVKQFQALITAIYELRETIREEREGTALNSLAPFASPAPEPGTPNISAARLHHRVEEIRAEATEGEEGESERSSPSESPRLSPMEDHQNEENRAGAAQSENEEESREVVMEDADSRNRSGNRDTLQEEGEKEGEKEEEEEEEEEEEGFVQENGPIAPRRGTPASSSSASRALVTNALRDGSSSVPASTPASQQPSPLPFTGFPSPKISVADTSRSQSEIRDDEDMVMGLGVEMERQPSREEGEARDSDED
ncbi:uncharacterized protein VTP21DRAFT_9838 [Calcarisporiella thermophila]|uniref:uncharacterized protein n=1 Tax=Calcarisporiella thermophila TaxID=911321 RepID=UPI00374437D5